VVRERVHVVSIPNEDPEEGDAIVNALQSRAAVVVQRSRGEGFGMAVMEAMWKRRPVVASRVGGLQEQVVEGKTGFLVEPEDRACAGEAICRLLREPQAAAAMGEAGHEHVAARFLLHHDLPRWGEVIEYVLALPAEPQPV
jgi:trehalose synthase